MTEEAPECCVCLNPMAWSLDVDNPGEENPKAVLKRVNMAVKDPLALLGCTHAVCANCYVTLPKRGIPEKRNCPICRDPIPEGDGPIQAGEHRIIKYEWEELFEGAEGRAWMSAIIAFTMSFYGKLPFGPVMGALATERFLELASGNRTPDGKWWRRGFLMGAAGGWAAFTVFFTFAFPKQWLSMNGMIQVADISMWKKVLRVPLAGSLGLATFGSLASVGVFGRDSMSREMNRGRPPIPVNWAKFLGICWVTTLVAVPTHRLLNTKYDLAWWKNPGLVVGPIAGAYMVGRLAT